MDVSSIVLEFGAYYEKAAQNKNRILAMLTQGIETPKYCTPIKTDDTVYKMASLTIGDIVQAFQKSWTPKDPIAFMPNKLELYHFKIDEELFPDDIEATWLGFLASDAVSRKDWPLVKFLIEHPDQGIIAGINRDMELKEYGHGVATDYTPTVPSITGQTMNGLIHQLKTGVENDTINSIDISPLDKDTIAEQVEDFIEQINEAYQHVAMNVHMSPKWYRAYMRDRRQEGYYTITSPGQVKDEIDFTPMKVVPLPSLIGSDIIFATPKQNLLHLTKKGNNKTKIDVQESKRVVNLLADWWEGIGFGINGAVWTNYLPQEGSAPTGS